MRPLWTRLALGALGLVVVLIVLGQVFLPGYLEGRVEDRLTENGGNAQVKLEAIPAVLLVLGHGDKIEARGHGLSFDLEEQKEPVLDRLNGFDVVDVRLTDTTTGPFDEQEISISRIQGAEDYSMVVHARTTGEELAAYAARRVGGGFLGGLAARLGAGAIDAAQKEVPVDLDLRMTEDGKVSGSDAQVGRVPLGPFAQSLASVVVSRL